MDRQKEERERGVTISCTTKEFFTDKWHYTIIDAPGERADAAAGRSTARAPEGAPRGGAARGDPALTRAGAPPPALPRARRPQGFHQEHDFRRRPGRRVPAHGPRRR